MSKKLYEESDVQAIADSIRAKNGSSGKYTVSQMAAEVGKLSAEELISNADIPDYVKAEALEVARKVTQVQTDKTITFLAISDSHYYGDQGSSGVDTYVDSNGTQGNVSNLHCAMAAKILTYALKMDFIAHLGDMTWGNKTTTPELLHSQVETLSGYLQEAYGSFPKFCCVGNHDSGIYYHNAQIAAGQTGKFTESAEWIYDHFTKFSESDSTVISGKDCGGYCYRDFADKKLRVFMLNTSQALIQASSDNCTYGSQRIWFGQALLNLNAKENASEWSFLILAHYPADYGGTMPLSELLKAYIEGGSISITDERDGTATTLNFSEHNGAKMIAQFHGHVHNFLVSKLYSYSSGSGKQYDAWRVGIPNAQYNRENYYSTVGKYTDISFAEEKSYPKTPNTGKDTSFVVNVVDPEEQVIHSFCYGAGYDRTIGYGATVYYSISAVLTNVTIDNAATSAEKGSSYTATITPKDGYTIDSVTVTMGGVDVTSSAYQDGVISIAEVTGELKITAAASKPVTYTNLVPTSTDASGAVYNGTGYKDFCAIDSSGGEKDVSVQFSATGFIPVKKGDTIRIGGSAAGRDYTEYNWRVCFYDSSYGFLQNRNGSQWAANGTYTAEDNGVHAWAPNQYACTDTARFMRLSCRTNDSGAATANGAGLIVTVNEPIE